MLPKAILLIDPEPYVRELLGYALEDGGYFIVAVGSVEEATAVLSSFRFDLIITEAFRQTDCLVFNPTFLATLREFCRETRIVLSSTCPSVDDLRAGDFGLAAIIPKPFALDELRNTIDMSSTRVRVPFRASYPISTTEEERGLALPRPSVKQDLVGIRAESKAEVA